MSKNFITNCRTFLTAAILCADGPSRPQYDFYLSKSAIEMLEAASRQVCLQKHRFIAPAEWHVSICR